MDQDQPPRERRSSTTDGRQSHGGARALSVYGAAVAVAVAPLLVGSGPLWAQLVSSAVVFAATALFLATRGPSVRSIPFALPAALGVAMTALQLVPLPRFLVRLLSPHAFELRSDASRGAVPWLMPLTLDVPATVIELAKGMACLALLLIVGTAARRGSRARPLVLTLAFIGGAVALVHTVQRLVGATEILGVYAVRDLPGGGFFGTFVNGNQASALLTLSGLIAAGLALQAQGVLRGLAIASFLLSAGTAVSSGSRAGIAGLALGLFLFGALQLSRRYGPRRATVISAGVIAVLGGMLLWTWEGLRHRIADTAADRLADQKIRGWSDSLRVVRAYPLVGVGRGAFEAPATPLRENTEGVRLSYPENIALQLSSEWGLPITLALAILMVLAARRVVPLVPRLDPATQAAACGVAAMLFHDLGDFGLELPGVAFPAVAALGLVIARSEQQTDSGRSRGRRLALPALAPALAGWVIALLVGRWALAGTLLADGTRARGLVVRKDPAAATEIDAAIRRHPADYYLELLAGSLAADRGEESAGRHLNRAQALNPSNSDVHLVTARWLARNKRPSQAALEYRLARERGASLANEELWAAVGPRWLGDAAPRTVSFLMDAARFLLSKGRLAEAQAASARALETDESKEPALVERLRLAVSSGDRDFVGAAARELLAVAREPDSFAAAARALEQIGQPAAADGAIDLGLTANPRDNGLIVAGTRLRLGRNDLAGAMKLIPRGDEETLTIRERIELEELQATIAEKQGDAVTAAALHAHARGLSRLADRHGDDR